MRSDLLDYTRRDLVISNFVEKTIISKITVSEEEARKFYDQNPDKFMRPESVRASHILIGVDSKASAEEKKAAREKADKLRKELDRRGRFRRTCQGKLDLPQQPAGGGPGEFRQGADGAGLSSRPLLP